MPLLDPDPVATPRVAGAAPPEHFESAVARGVERIRAGELDKLVLAREVRVHAPAPIDPAPVFDALRAGFPACYCYLVGTPELAFVGASPELLVRREGARAQTVALAGTTRRSADPSVDDLLGEQLLQSDKQREEQAIVVRRIERTLRPVSVWVAAADEPVLVKVQNVQHLATPIRAQLADPVSCVELAGRLHPTPAVGGEPPEKAAPLIPALEGLDRGWYAGHRGLERPVRGRRVLRGHPLRAAARQGGAPLRGERDRARLGAGGRARRDRGQAPGAAAAAGLTTAFRVSIVTMRLRLALLLSGAALAVALPVVASGDVLPLCAPTAGDDNCQGTTGPDSYDMLAGNDRVLGLDGDDVILGNLGNDQLVGGEGNDNLDGGPGDDSVNGGNGNDMLTGGDGTDVILSGAGDDTANGGAGDDNIAGDDGNDTLSGGDGVDRIDGADGNDSIFGNAGNDRLNGGLGDDKMSGGDGADSVSGNDGNDSLAGDGGNDTLHGNAGNDKLVGGLGDDNLFGEDGNDTLIGRRGQRPPRGRQRQQRPPLGRRQRPRLRRLRQGHDLGRLRQRHDQPGHRHRPRLSGLRQRHALHPRQQARHRRLRAGQGHGGGRPEGRLEALRERRAAARLGRGSQVAGRRGRRPGPSPCTNSVSRTTELSDRPRPATRDLAQLRPDARKQLAMHRHVGRAIGPHFDQPRRLRCRAHLIRRHGQRVLEAGEGRDSLHVRAARGDDVLAVDVGVGVLGHR